jgi:hypothetical protein
MIFDEGLSSEFKGCISAGLLSLVDVELAAVSRSISGVMLVTLQ